MKKVIWITWLVITLMIAGYLLFKVVYSEDKSEFLIGETTYGHYQIEMECSACHTKSFTSQEAIQDACVGCHAVELAAAHDSHPKKKFTDPREAFRLEKVDGRFCISCHTEHKKDQTHPMGVTLPTDYCFHCHEKIGEDRESHKGLPFDSCASAGCHNFHDNRALYEDFLIQNAHQPWLKEIARIAQPNAAKKIVVNKNQVEQNLFQEKRAEYPEQTHEWQQSTHADAGVQCGGCHATKAQPDLWIEKPGIAECKNCHDPEVQGFTKGKHGMRLATESGSKIGAISPIDARLTFNPESLHVQHGCNSCHSAHTFNTSQASVGACLDCHADKHSLAFEQSPHGQLWIKQIKGQREETLSPVSCATCHMPRVEKKIAGETVVYVQHNQNDNLRPNEKMIRSVCMNCHGLAFSIDALADPALIENNFTGKPGTHIESVDWALRRVTE